MASNTHLLVWQHKTCSVLSTVNSKAVGENINQVRWPACGEIDIIEFVGNDPDDVHGSTHGTGFSTTSAYYNAGGFSSDFHVYGVNWQPDSIEFYGDGNTYATMTPSNYSEIYYLFRKQIELFSQILV